MLALTPVVLAVAVTSLNSWRLVAARLFVATLVCAMTVAPFIVSISRMKGRPTIGEAGTLTYVKTMNGVPYPHWQGQPNFIGALRHPSRTIFVNPTIFEFGAPVPGTYPIGYDPSYWYKGMTRADLAKQRQALVLNALVYCRLFFIDQFFLVLALCVMLITGRRRLARRVDVLRHFSLAVIAAVAMSVYGVVLVELAISGRSCRCSGQTCWRACGGGRELGHGWSRLLSPALRCCRWHGPSRAGGGISTGAICIRRGL